MVIMGISLSVVGRQWSVLTQRELEADLLAKGLEIQNALALYSATKKAGRVVPGEIYPHNLEELTKPPKPFLRKAYNDPMKRGDWELIRAPTGGIKGVRSTSNATPIKQANFPPALRHFEGLTRYQDWIFQFPNPSMPGQQATAPAPQGGSAPAPAPPSTGTTLPTQ